MEKNLTTGSVGRQLIGFSLPYLLSYLLQTLYGMADLFIIGRYEGVAGTTAVAVGSQVMHMLTVMIVGLAMGTTLSIARAIGADDRPQAAAATGNTVTLFLSLSLVLTAGLLLLRRPITAVMSTPEAAVEGTVRYLTICFPGIPCITAYNILSAIFRGMGDSKSPMIFIFIACLANIALDYLFIGALHLGPAGAALGTSLSQAISVAVSLAVIVRRRTMPLAKADLRPHPRRVPDVPAVSADAAADGAGERRRLAVFHLRVRVRVYVYHPAGGKPRERSLRYGGHVPCAGRGGSGDRRADLPAGLRVRPRALRRQPPAVAGALPPPDGLHPRKPPAARRLLPRDHPDRLRPDKRHRKIRHRDHHPRPGSMRSQGSPPRGAGSAQPRLRGCHRFA